MDKYLLNRPYEKPTIKKLGTMNFPLRILLGFGENIVCKQCSSCHSCR